MSNTPDRISPLHDVLAALNPRVGTLHGMPVVLDFGNAPAEAQRLPRLALCDASAFPRFGVTGKGAEAWLKANGVPVPGPVYGNAALPADGLCLRLGRNEFVIEDGCEGELVGQLWSTLGTGGDGVYPVLRQEAQFLLSGVQAWKVLAQACGYDFRTPGEGLVFTRIAGVSCSVLHQAPADYPIFRLWLDPSQGVYLWEALLEIVRDMDGGLAGIASFYPHIRTLA